MNLCKAQLRRRLLILGVKKHLRLRNHMSLQPVWQTAIREELKSLEDAGTFERVHISDLCTDTKALNRSSDALHYRSDGA